MNAYRADRNDFRRNVRIFYRCIFPLGSVVISKYVIDNDAMIVGSLFELNARIAPNENEDTTNIRWELIDACILVGNPYSNFESNYKTWRIMWIYLKKLPSIKAE